MIKILHLIDQYKVGGPGKTIINTAKYIDRNIFRLHIATFRPDGNDTELSQEIKRCGIDYLSLEDLKGISWKNLWSLLNYINVNNISIYHSHGYKADVYGILLHLLKNDLIIITTHHGWIRNTLTQVIVGKITLKSSFLFAHTIIVSDEMKRHLSKYVLRNMKYSVIHNAIRMEDYCINGIREEQRQLMNIKKNEIVLLSVGRLSKEKGCLNLLDAFIKINQNNKNIKLVYVGDGPLVAYLEKQIKKFNVSDNVLLMGHNQRVQPYYEAADIFISPSDSEGLSNVILEAMAYSIPVVATNVGGNPEIIKHQVNGILVEPRNVDALAEAINYLILNPDKRADLGLSGYNNVVRNFSFDTRTKEIEYLYLKLAKDNMNK